MSKKVEELIFALNCLEQSKKGLSDYVAQQLVYFVDMLHFSKDEHPQWDNDIFKALTILNTKMGEASQAALEFYEMNGDIDDIQENLEAALCVIGGVLLRTLIHINDYDLNI
jgi:hypothetical protein